MPSPVGHALGGLTAAFLINAFARRPALTVGLLATSAVVAVAPDLDTLVGSHRTYTHSIGGVAIVALAVWLILRKRSAGAAGTAALTAAYASHLVLDWLSKDTSKPSGLAVLWPFTFNFYKSGLDLFGQISRRYWLPEEFIIGNVKAAMWECVLVAPCLFLAWVLWSKRTLKTNIEKGKTNKACGTR
jgi:inner membrane protein